jgi:hypothetical protein
MEPEGSLLHSQEPATCPYPEHRKTEYVTKNRLHYLTSNRVIDGSNSGIDNVFLLCENVHSEKRPQV